MSINKNDLSIVSIAKCYSSFEVYRNGFDRLTQEPIDLFKGSKIHPLEVVTDASNYYFLDHDASGGPNGGKHEIVGYMRVSVNNKNESINIEEFEIFREYRGRGFGRLFAQHLMLFFSDHYIFIHGMCTASFAFWWSSVPELILQMFGVEFGYIPEVLDITNEERQSRIDKFFENHPQSDDAVREIMTIIAKNFISSSEDDDETILIKDIESIPRWKSIKEKIYDHKCMICYEINTQLLLCNGNGHKLCKECMNKIVGQTCPGRCSTKPIHIYEDHPSSWIYDINFMDE